MTPSSRGKIRKPGSKNLEEILECDDPNFIDFIRVRILGFIFDIVMLTMGPIEKIEP